MSVNSLIYPQNLLKYLNSSCICMPKTCAHTKQALGQSELRVSVQTRCKKHLYAEWKWKICTIKLIGKRNTGRFPHSQVFHLLSQFTHTIPRVLSSPLNFPELYCLRLHLLFASLQLISAFIFHCES